MNSFHSGAILPPRPGQDLSRNVPNVFWLFFWQELCRRKGFSKSEKFPNLFRAFRYPLSFWIKIITARAKEMSISNEKYEFTGMAFNICVCNAQYFGGGWNISPKSSLQDGLFNIQVFAVTKIKAMQIFFLAKKGLHLKESSVKLKRLSQLTVNSRDPIEIDGDFFGYGPADIFIKKRAIRFKI